MWNGGLWSNSEWENCKFTICWYLATKPICRKVQNPKILILDHDLKTNLDHFTYLQVLCGLISTKIIFILLCIYIYGWLKKISNQNSEVGAKHNPSDLQLTNCRSLIFPKSAQLLIPHSISCMNQYR
jgi:hypothetical protein